MTEDNFHSGWKCLALGRGLKQQLLSFEDWVGIVETADQDGYSHCLSAVADSPVAASHCSVHCQADCSAAAYELHAFLPHSVSVDLHSEEHQDLFAVVEYPVSVPGSACCMLQQQVYFEEY